MADYNHGRLEEQLREDLENARREETTRYEAASASFIMQIVGIPDTPRRFIEAARAYEIYKRFLCKKILEQDKMRNAVEGSR